MLDFMLEPDELDPKHPERRRPVRLVTTGLAPTADLPTTRRGTHTPPCSTPCEACSRMVLVGTTPTGQRLALDTGIRTYVVSWQDTGGPTLHESRGYPVHTCKGET